LDEKPVRQVVIRFGSLSDFEDAFEREGSILGLFHRSNRPPDAGSRVRILVAIRSFESPFSLEGEVLWRRLKKGPKGAPPGAFIGLLEKECARLDFLLRYLRSAASRHERRKHARYPVFLKAMYLTDTGRYPSKIQNLSRSGAFVQCSGPLLVAGEQFPMTLYFGADTGPGVIMNARVAWTSYLEDMRGMGIEFIPEQPQQDDFHEALKDIETGWDKDDS
jgi:hypothetical protein